MVRSQAAPPLLRTAAAQPAALMDQQPSRLDQQPYKRLAELKTMAEQAIHVMDTLFERVADDEAAGIPATPGSAQAVYDAAFIHLRRVRLEEDAILRHIGEWPLTCPLSCKHMRSEPALLGARVRGAPAWACPPPSVHPLCMLPPPMLQTTRRSTRCLTPRLLCA